MKIATAIAFICFMGISVYVLLNEKNMGHPHAKVNVLKSTSPSKLLGEKKRTDLYPFELQKQRIDSTTIYKFESKNLDDNYEMDEEELDAFSRGLNGLRDARDAGQIQLVRPLDVNSEKKYYQFDKEN